MMKINIKKEKIIILTAAAVTALALLIFTVILSNSASDTIISRNDRQMREYISEIFPSATAYASVKIDKKSDNNESGSDSVDIGDIFALYADDGESPGWLIITRRKALVGYIDILTGISPVGSVERVIIRDNSSADAVVRLQNEYAAQMTGLRDTVQIDMLEIPVGAEINCRLIADTIKNIIVFDLVSHPDALTPGDINDGSDGTGDNTDDTEPSVPVWNPGDESGDTDNTVSDTDTQTVEPDETEPPETKPDGTQGDTDKETGNETDKITKGDDIKIEDPPETTVTETFIDTMPETEPPETETTDTETTETEPTGTEPIGTEPAETEPTGTEPAGTKPAETEPIGTEPAGTEPIGTDPVETDLPEIEPPETAPIETEPPETDPSETETDPVDETT